MASSKIDISNSAILKVGGNRINSFNDNKVEAVVVNEFYERSVRWLFAQYYWGFASMTSKLALVPTAPEFEYQYAFALPSDFIRVQRTFPNTNYKIVGDQLHTNEKEIGIKYTQRVDEVAFPIYFEQTMMYYLAEQITVPITENTTKADSNFVKYIDHLKRAKSLDAQQHPQDGFDDFPLDDSRYGMGVNGMGRF